ncbi:zinc finger protein 185-like [Megalops cyprinoides]|uniref:zinc finger protein 185-like n=1 Tax=Megalops cyprinoides TaxID=118141 RepID=UPI001865135A|nr:zinc finger protein 185-like [Megalops cyprinoides]
MSQDAFSEPMTEFHPCLHSKLETCSDLPPSLESASQNAEASDSETKKGFVFVKEYVNTTELSKHNTAGAENDKGCVGTSACKCCGDPVRSDGRIIIEHLNVFYHPNCFKCGVCAKPMGDLLYSMFLRGAVVYCETCYPGLS